MGDRIQIVVWDQFVRVFHWSLMLFILLAYVTGDTRGPLHKYIGSVVLALVIIRILWGFWGTQHALFSNFICSPFKALTYLKELVAGKPTHYVGHNPAAAWMIILLLVSSIIICLSGYAACTSKGKRFSVDFENTFSFVENAYADEDENERYNGKRRGHEWYNNRDKESFESDSVWSDIHEISIQFMLILICLHIIGVAVSSKIHNENLIQSMITGKKYI